MSVELSARRIVFLGLLLLCAWDTALLGCATAYEELTRREIFHISRTRVTKLAAPTAIAGSNPSLLRGTGNERYIFRARGLGREIAKSFPLAAQVKTVFYPASGCDAATAFLLFPEAQQVIAIDDHPFVEGNFSPYMTRLALSQYPNMDSGFAPAQDLDRLGETGPGTLRFLLDAIPNARILKVEIVERLEKESLLAKPVRRVHGICEFDTGPGTPVRRLIQLNTRVTKYNSSLSGWWMKELNRVQPDAVIIKGAMLHLNVMPYQLLQNIKLMLRQSKGLLVEDRIERGNREGFELSGTGGIPGIPSDDTRIFSSHLNFGYQDEVKVTSFHRVRNDF